ncbi:MAG: hypothetical protein KAU29_00450 [Gammaproteobacteria bacterium]|nr:hypothetical protein [Gammaproteobacteria bacterium]
MKTELSIIDNLPPWIHWLAQDADGVWWGFEVEPLQADHSWYENEVGQYLRLEAGKPNPQWRNSLRRR